MPNDAEFDFETGPFPPAPLPYSSIRFPARNWGDHMTSWNCLPEEIQWEILLAEESGKPAYLNHAGVRILIDPDFTVKLEPAAAGKTAA